VFKLVKMAVTLSLIGVLSGCSLLSSTPSNEAMTNLPQRQKELAALTEFNISASIYVKTPEKGVSGSLEWQQQGEYFQASMQNVFGLNVFTIKTDKTGAEVTVDGQTHTAQTASVLLDYLSGWSLPIEEMPMWLKGMAGDSAEAMSYDALGRLQSFTLRDSQGREWQISYQKFFTNRLALPKLIVLRSADTSIKVGIREWEL
jgi:outer membrane lipoprotein LolB